MTATTHSTETFDWYCPECGEGSTSKYSSEAVAQALADQHNARQHKYRSDDMEAVHEVPC